MLRVLGGGGGGGWMGQKVDGWKRVYKKEFLGFAKKNIQKL